MSTHSCRLCSEPLDTTFVDLGASPFANSYLTEAAKDQPERFYPLHVYRCRVCHLVQLPAFESPETIFRDYAYFSSYSDSWMAHAEAYTEAMIDRFGFGGGDLVVEVASNDGYLLRHFKARDVPVLGIEPARNVAEAAEALGIPTVTEFFGREIADSLVADGKRADLIAANNVLAHTPFLNDFVDGLARLVSPDGVVTLEFPHLVALVERNQFDTIYHEHFSYFSALAVEKVLADHGLAIFDIERLATHGGSLRIFAQPAATGRHPIDARVTALLDEERAKGYEGDAPYRGFADRVEAIRRGLLRFLIDRRESGETVAGYGAPAKGNTLLNYCGVRGDLLPFTVDRSPHKQGHYLPGTRIPIRDPEALRAERPDYVLILPWNLETEIVAQLDDLRQAGTRFVVAIPDVHVLDDV